MLKAYKLYRQFKPGSQKPDREYSIWMKLVLPLIGFLAFIWFLIRVIPKPSRAAYPCQRIAFPLASSFIIWLAGIFGALTFIKRAKRLLNKRRIVLGFLCLTVSVIFLWASLNTTVQKSASAQNMIPNQPIGIAKGIFPGRVVWLHDPNATNWTSGNGYPWQAGHTEQKFVKSMLSKAMRELTGTNSDVQAWDELFRHYNVEHSRGDRGYQRGEKITIKVNLVTNGVKLWTVNPSTYEKEYYLDKSDVSPHLIVAILDQLVHKAGVEPNDIAVGDTLTYFPNQWWNICHSAFPEVTFFDMVGNFGRVKATSSNVKQYWSHGQNPNLYAIDYVPQLYVEADYLINIAVLKGHGAGVSLCAKNNYGSYCRNPDDAGYYNLHDSLAGFNTADAQYRALVDILGHPSMGAKTLLYMLDGLYGGYYWEGTPYKFHMAPFNNDWPSSIFMSQDPVAIDSVGLDILWEEWPSVVRIGGVEDYLHEAALADNPPSGTFYDPDHDGVKLQSLGVHEHWNNQTDKQYSRNLGTGNGIELRYIKLKHYPGDLNSDNVVGIEDLIQLTGQWLWTGNAGEIPEDLNEDGKVNLLDFNVLSKNWGNS
jgi:hypothetical protein